MKENSIKDIIEEKYTRYLNCETDIIGLTLEEAKFILETGERRNYVTSILQEAVKVLLSDYKRVLKENEKYKRLNEMNLKNAEEFKNNMCEHRCLLKSENEELQRENEELKEDRDKFKKALGKRITYCNELEKDLFENGSNYIISKQIVKDKIEELKKKVEELTDDKGYWGGSDLLEQIKVLQELLEENENHIPRID